MIFATTNETADYEAEIHGETYVVTEGPSCRMVMPLRLHDATTDGPIIYTAEPPDGETER